MIRFIVRSLAFFGFLVLAALGGGGYLLYQTWFAEPSLPEAVVESQ